MNALMLATLFREQGHDAQAWYLMKTGEMEAGDTPVKLMSTKGRVKNPLRLVGILYRYIKALYAFRPDAIVGHHPLANIVAALAKACGLTKKCFGSQHNPSESQSRATGWLEKQLGRTWLYDANICVSQAVADSFGQYPAAYREKLMVIHNGVPPLPAVLKTPAECRQHFGLPMEAKIIGSLGRLHPQKNIGFLLECMVTLPDALLVIAGDGIERQTLTAQVEALGIAERVKFMGVLQGSDVPMFYRAMDVFAMPSRYEGFGRTLVEAFALEVPVVCTDLDVLREVAADAAILTPLQVNAWAAALSTLLSQPEQRQRCIALGRARVQHFSLEVMRDKYLAVITA